jgi:predicted house-cleaning NTP pyrophosphatase (Maf/HAM1 superfamily)
LNALASPSQRRRVFLEQPFFSAIATAIDTDDLVARRGEAG